MTFENPFYLYALFILPPLALTLFIMYKQTFSITKRLTLEKSMPIKLRFFYSRLFSLTALFCLIFAAASPVVTTTLPAEALSSKDIVFAFDVSRSMNVQDIVFENETKSRLEISRITASDLLKELESNTNNRYALALGKGDGVLAVPLTYGTEVIKTFFNSLSDSLLSSSGTNIEKLLLAAKSAFNHDVMRSFPAQKEIALFTDGESHSGDFDEALRECRDEGIAVYVICAGSEKGGRVPVNADEEGFIDEYLKDSNGKEIISKAQPQKLKLALESNGGFLFNAENTSSILIKEAVEKIISRQSGDDAQTLNIVTQKIHLNFIFLILALLFFAARVFITHRFVIIKGFQRKIKTEAACLFLISIIMTSCGGIEARFRIIEGNFYLSREMFDKANESYNKALLVSKKDTASYALFALSAASLEKEDENRKAALGLLEKSHELLSGNADFSENHKHEKKEKELAFRVHYNAGIFYYIEGDAENAARQFRQALIADSGRIEAKRNLEISLLHLPEKMQNSAQSSVTARPVSEGESKGSEVLFDFIQKKEENRWKSWGWQGEKGDASMDY